MLAIIVVAPNESWVRNGVFGSWGTRKGNQVDFGKPEEAWYTSEIGFVGVVRELVSNTAKKTGTLIVTNDMQADDPLLFSDSRLVWISGD